MRCYEVTQRFVLHAGYSCNERCEFCYYLDDLQRGRIKDWGTADNKRRIRLAVAYGKRMIDISGGEPTIRKDLPELIAYSGALGLEKINIITNGLRTANYDYCRRLKDAGLTEGLFSLHSHDARVHDSLTRVKGSHERLCKSLENFKSLGLARRINTVVCNINYRNLNELFALVEASEPEAVNLLVFNPSQTADKLPRNSEIRFTDYRLVGQVIAKALSNWKDRIKVVNVRFLAFCFLKDHPECIRTLWQKVHEDHEWDPFLHISFEKGYSRAAVATIAGASMRSNVPRYKSANIQTRLSKYLTGFRRRYLYHQNEACLQCSLSPICPGIPKDFAAKFGFPPVRPFRFGTKIYDPLYYVKKQSHGFKSLREIRQIRV